MGIVNRISMKICDICKYEIRHEWNWYNWQNKTYHWECIKNERK